MKTSLEDTQLFDDLMKELEAFRVTISDEPDTKNTPDPFSARVWVVDDASVNVKVVEKHLRAEGYKNIQGFTNPRNALQRLETESPDVVLLDIMMPEVSGIEVLTILRSRPATRHTPVLILSASNDRDTRLEALELGATDFLEKPVDRVELIVRLRNSLSLKAHHDRLEQYSERLEEAVKQRTTELAASRLEVVHCLARASEFRDDITGRHVFRVGRFAGLIGLELGMTGQQAHLLELAAQLHDVGKIAVPDGILLKEGKLEPEEYAVMKKHCSLGTRVFQKMDPSQWVAFREHATLGGELLGSAQSPLIRLASRIALTHHEWYNGDGYPLGLSGDDIPLEGRITAVADVFDALASRRPYKPAYPVSKCFDILEENRGTQFDPMVLDAFLARREDVIEVQLEHADMEEM
jgi:putative two-component system response regulator